MMGELLALADLIEDEGLRGKVLEVLEVPDVDLDGEALPFEVCPGGAYVHHAYEGGLLQHTLAVTRLCLTVYAALAGAWSICWLWSKIAQTFNEKVVIWEKVLSSL